MSATLLDASGNPTTRPMMGGFMQEVGPDGKIIKRPITTEVLRELRGQRNLQAQTDPYEQPSAPRNRRDNPRHFAEHRLLKRTQHQDKTNRTLADYDATLQTADERGYRPVNRIEKDRMPTQRQTGNQLRAIDKDNQRVKQATDNTGKTRPEKMSDREKEDWRTQPVIKDGRIVARGATDRMDQEKKTQEATAARIKANREARLTNKRAAVKKEDARNNAQKAMETNAARVTKDIANTGVSFIRDEKGNVLRDENGKVTGRVTTRKPNAKSQIDGLPADQAIKIAKETAEDKRAEQEGIATRVFPKYQDRVTKVKQDAADIAAAGKAAGEAARQRIAAQTPSKPSVTPDDLQETGAVPRGQATGPDPLTGRPWQQSKVDEIKVATGAPPKDLSPKGMSGFRPDGMTPGGRPIEGRITPKTPQQIAQTKEADRRPDARPQGNWNVADVGPRRKSITESKRRANRITPPTYLVQK